jgi:phosphomannomutase/phosphoglucomutase
MFGKEINLMGIQGLGMAGRADRGTWRQAGGVTGHDFRGYSASIKYSLISGSMESGCKVYDIGPCMTPMAYFRAIRARCAPVVTASHNDNRWTDVKMDAPADLWSRRNDPFEVDRAQCRFQEQGRRFI